jgi:hypothetical protein
VLVEQRASWEAAQRTWAATLDRAAAMPAGTVDVSIEGEWTFAQTLRHVTFAVDAWLRRGILDLANAFHPYGQPDSGTERDGFDMSLLTSERPAYDDVVDVFLSRQRMVRDFVATVSAETLAEPRPAVWEPDVQLRVLDCLHVILDESWEHRRYAERDLDAIAAAPVLIRPGTP